MRKFLLPLIAIMLLTLACSSGGRAKVTPPPSNPDGKVLFFDDFSNNNKKWDLAVEGDVREIVDGVMRFNQSSAKTDIWTLAPVKAPGDVIVDVDTAFVSGSRESTIGVICGYSSTENFHVISFGFDGYYEIYKYVNDEYVSIASGNDTTNIKQDANKITAKCISDRLTLISNGVVIAEGISSDLRPGQVGLMTGSYDSVPNEFTFDNLIISEPAK